MTPLDRLLAVVREPWRDDAACRDAPPWKESAGGDRWTQQRFKAEYCAHCEVVGECLDDAMAFWDEQGVNPNGVWGDSTAPERERLRAVWVAERLERSA